MIRGHSSLDDDDDYKVVEKVRAYDICKNYDYGTKMWAGANAKRSALPPAGYFTASRQPCPLCSMYPLPSLETHASIRCRRVGRLWRQSSTLRTKKYQWSSKGKDFGVVRTDFALYSANMCRHHYWHTIPLMRTQPTGNVVFEATRIARLHCLSDQLFPHQASCPWIGKIWLNAYWREFWIRRVRYLRPDRDRLLGMLTLAIIRQRSMQSAPWKVCCTLLQVLLEWAWWYRRSI